MIGDQFRYCKFNQLKASNGTTGDIDYPWLAAMHRGVYLDSCQSRSGVKLRHVVLREKSTSHKTAAAASLTLISLAAAIVYNY